MLNENIKAIRKSKGFSQQELAIKLNVVRQTVSKWEQGLSVPDSDMLISMSKKYLAIVSCRDFDKYMLELEENTKKWR